MSSTATDGSVERRLTAHLHRAGELLRGGQIDEADAEVAKALELRDRDVRARNLLGLVRFRAGRHEEALDLYRQLLEEDPADASLRLNLGLVELRMGRHRDAAANLALVVEREPQNLRAHGYHGLALMRSGDLARAREAFLAAGQEDMVRQVDERTAVEPGAAGRARAEVSRIADGGLRVVSAEQPFTPAEAELPPASGDGMWQVRNAGEPPPAPAPEGAPMRSGEVAPLGLELPQSLHEFATARLLLPGILGEPFAIAEGGLLVVRVDGRLPTRTFGAIASSGQLVFSPMMRRVRGLFTDEPFGTGAEQLFLAAGAGMIVVSGHGAKFTALSLKEDVLYLRESALFSFEETLHWENGRIPGSGGATPMVQLRGTGRCVVRARPSFCLRMAPDETLYVGADVLLGWIGRVTPRQIKGSDGEPTPYIECSGEGTLILEDPPLE